MRICMERLLGPKRTQSVQFPLPKITSVNDAATALTAILESVAAGKIAPSEGTEIATLLAGFVRLSEAGEIEQRLLALEHVNHAR